MDTLVKQRIKSRMILVLPCAWVLTCILSSCAGQPTNNSEVQDLKKQIILLQKVQGQQQTQLEELNNKVLLLRDRVDGKSTASSPEPHAPGDLPAPEMPETSKMEVAMKPTPKVSASTAPPAVTASMLPESSTAPEKIYNQALNDAKKPQTQFLERDVETLLKSYRESPATNNALFLLAETLYQRQQYSKAAEEYERLYKMFPDGNKAVGSLYRLGLCYEKMGHSDEAKEAYQNVISIYPGSREALDAEKRLENGSGEQ
jgi:TolA-binding protein